MFWHHYCIYNIWYYIYGIQYRGHIFQYQYRYTGTGTRVHVPVLLQYCNRHPSAVRVLVRVLDTQALGVHAWHAIAAISIAINSELLFCKYGIAIAIAS